MFIPASVTMPRYALLRRRRKLRKDPPSLPPVYVVTHYENKFISRNMEIARGFVYYYKFLDQ